MHVAINHVAAKKLCEDVLVKTVLENTNSKSDSAHPTEEELLDLLVVAEALYLTSMRPVDKQWAPCTNWMTAVRSALNRAGKPLLSDIEEEETKKEVLTYSRQKSTVTNQHDSALTLID